MARARIIVVDDDRSFLEAVTIYLEDYGYQVIDACSVRQAQARLRRQHVDCAVIDVHLPDGRGTELADEIDRLQPSVPVLLVSSDDSVQNVRKCRTSKKRLFLAKPLLPQCLLESIVQVLPDCGRPVAMVAG